MTFSEIKKKFPQNKCWDIVINHLRDVRKADVRDFYFNADVEIISKKDFEYEKAFEGLRPYAYYIPLINQLPIDLVYWVKGIDDLDNEFVYFELTALNDTPDRGNEYLVIDYYIKERKYQKYHFDLSHYYERLKRTRDEKVVVMKYVSCIQKIIDYLGTESLVKFSKDPDKIGDIIIDRACRYLSDRKLIHNTSGYYRVKGTYDFDGEWYYDAEIKCALQWFEEDNGSINYKIDNWCSANTHWRRRYYEVQNEELNVIKCIVLLLVDLYNLFQRAFISKFTIGNYFNNAFMETFISNDSYTFAFMYKYGVSLKVRKL